VTAALSGELRLTGDQLRVVAMRAGIHDLPTVLATPPRHTAVDRREAAHARAARELLSCSLIGDDSVHPDLIPVLGALQHPERELAMRLVTPEGTARVSVVRRGTLCVRARRVGGDVTLRILGQGSEFRDVARALLAELPAGRPANIEPVGAPMHEVAASLSDTHDAVALADRIRALGTDPHSATLLGSALAAREAFAEIVYSALDDTEGRICRRPAAVAVFYTKRGRVVAVPSASPGGQLWTTLKPGSDQAIGRAIGQLVALADAGWAPDSGNAL
jgi:hypothetical protein